MTSSASIDAAWQSAVWTHADIKAVSPVYFQFAMTSDSEPEISRCFYGTEVNFWEAATVKTNEFQLTGAMLEHFTVTVNYYIQKDPSGSAWQDARNAIETLFDTVRSQLGETWSDTVDFWEPQEGPPEIEEVTLADADCWRAQYKFIGTKQISIS